MLFAILLLMFPNSLAEVPTYPGRDPAGGPQKHTVDVVWNPW